MFFMMGFSRKIWRFLMFYSRVASLNFVAYLISMLKKRYFSERLAGLDSAGVVF
jgi:hypothetical protein